MRHNFVNDIGDYAKYALLRALCSEGNMPLRLGVIWYLTDHAESNGDGRRRPHLSREGWETLDPGLLEKMRSIENGLRSPADLHLQLIEDSGILPATTVYFSEPIPHAAGTAPQRLQERAAWFARAQQSVAGCKLVFVDPDNGLEVRSVSASSQHAGKYVTVSEMVALISGGAGVILYQHGSRSAWQAQREGICSALNAAILPPPRIKTVRFGAFGVRSFFCVSVNPDLTDCIQASLDTLQHRVTSWDRSHYLVIE